MGQTGGVERAKRRESQDLKADGTLVSTANRVMLFLEALLFAKESPTKTG